MSRSDSVADVLLSHIDWKGDCLIIQEQGHKADRKGQNRYWKHIYANSVQPEICPVLAVAVLIFCTSHRSEEEEGDEMQLFVGTNAKDRFANLLSATVKNLNDQEVKTLGCRREDAASHSIRKGGDKYCHGSVYCPNSVAVDLRMGHSIGTVKDRYVTAGEGSDQLVGRFVCGLNFLDDSMTVLPPHFTKDAEQTLDSQFWQRVIPGYERYPDGIKRCLPYFLACILHHENYLREKLSEDHPLFMQRIFSTSSTETLKFLRENCITGYRICDKTGMRATGVPPHLATTRRVKELQDSVDLLRSELKEVRNNLPSDIATEVCRDLRSEFTVEGVLPLTTRELHSQLQMLRSDMNSQLSQMQVQQLQVQRSSHNWVQYAQGWWGTWDGPLGRGTRFVPSDWTFRRYEGKCTKSMWDRWHFGDKETAVRPFRLLSKTNDICVKDRLLFNRFVKVMLLLDKLVSELRLLPVDKFVGDLTWAENDRTFSTVYKECMIRIEGRENLRLNDNYICYSTLYNRLQTSGLCPQFIKKRKKRTQQEMRN